MPRSIVLSEPTVRGSAPTMPAMTSSLPPQRAPEPGDRPPAGRLARPPSERYAPPAAATQAGSGARPWSAPRALLPAVLASIATAAALVVDGGVLAEERGLLAISGLGGAAIGLLAASAGVSADGVAAAPLPRGRVTRIAVLLAIATVVVAALGTWAYGRLEGGVMDPVTYLWTTFGPWVPAEAVLAVLAAAWGAGAGPVRWRS